MTAPLKDEMKTEETTLRQSCQRCGKTVRRQDSLRWTGWIFRPATCTCSEDELKHVATQSGSAEVASTADGTSVEQVGAETFPSLGEQYEVLACIGEGGMGSVYKVRDKSIDAIFAVKVLRKELAQDNAALKRFEQEAESAVKLSHANLVSVYSHGTTDDGAPYIVMDYLDGRGLADVLKECRNLDSKRAIRIFSDICDALSYAHKEGVIHRDIKPTNIIVTNCGEPAERAHIVDFGIAKAMPTANRETHDLTQTGEIFGSPNYMSPEQCLGFLVDNRSDIYSLGCLMYECLTGAPPYDGSNPIQIVVKHINEQPAEFPKAIKVDKNVDKLENVVFRCLDKEKTERYQSIDDVLRDLNSIGSGKQVSRYNKTSKPKAAFTKRQTIGFLVVFCGLTIYGTALAMSFSSEIGGRLIGGLMLTIDLAGVYVFYQIALEIYRKRVKVLTEANAWRLLLFAFLGTACLTVAQFPFMVMMGNTGVPYQLPWMEIYFYLCVTHILSLWGFISAGIGCLLFRSPKPLNAFLVSAKLLVIGIVIVAACCIGIPGQSAKWIYSFGGGFSSNHPKFARTLLVFASQLDNRNTEILSRLAEIEHTLNLHESELNRYNAIIAAEPKSSWRLYNRATCFEELKQFEKALNDYNSAIAADPKSTDPLLRRAEFLEKRARLLEALKDYRSALALAPNDTNLLEKITKLECRMGIFEDAAKNLDKLSTLTSPNNIQHEVLLGILYDQLGNTRQAKNAYRNVLALGETADASLLYKAWAAQRLGLMAEYTRWLKKAADSGYGNRDQLFDTLNLEGVPIRLTWPEPQ